LSSPDRRGKVLQLLAACGVAVAGGDSIIAVWHWASDACPQEVLAELGVWRDPFTGLHAPPSERTFRRVLGAVDGDQLDREVCAYPAGQAARSVLARSTANSTTCVAVSSHRASRTMAAS
jgi:hypothetical protein